MKLVDSSSLTGIDLGSAPIVHTFTAVEANHYYVRLFLDGASSYSQQHVYLIVQPLGVGLSYYPLTDSGGESIWETSALYAFADIVLQAGDILTIQFYGSGSAAGNVITEIWADDTIADNSTAVIAIDTQLSGTHGSGLWGGGLGTGAIQYTPNRVTDPNGNPTDGVETKVTTDSVGAHVVAISYTNALGLIPTPFSLDAGTYYIWRQHARYSFNNPETIIV